MLRRCVRGYDIAYVALGEGSPLVCVPGTPLRFSGMLWE